MSKVTEWIPCTTPPVRKGAYDVQRRNMDGSVKDEIRAIWKPGKRRFEHRKGWHIAVIDTQDYWRGLAEAP